jgi:sugar-specific transcriptional regulator TrmB
MDEKRDGLEESLLSINFSKKEASVYLALLELGRGTVSEITRKANINRTTGYTILNTLAYRGLVSISGKEPKQEYVAETPDKIMEILKNQIKKDQEYLEQAKMLLPQLKPLFNFRDRPRVRFYEGKEGLETVYEDTLTSHEEIRAYANVDDMHKALPNYFPRYYKRRADKGIGIRAIIPTNKVGLERITHDKEEKRESALVPENQYYFSPEINIYDNKVMIASLKENLGVIIESQEVADAMKTIYELAWAEAKRLDQEQRQVIQEKSSEG